MLITSTTQLIEPPINSTQDEPDAYPGISDAMTAALLTALHGATFQRALQHEATDTNYFGSLALQRLEERRLKSRTCTYPGICAVIDGHKYLLPVIYAGLDR